MDEWMILQAQMHQGQSHFATTPTREEYAERSRVTPAIAQQQQQPTALPAQAIGHGR